MAERIKPLDKNEVRSNLDDLFSSVENFREADNFQQMLAFVSSFKYLSPYNAFLLYQQRPETRYVLNASTWYKRFRRKIKPNSRPMIVLVPFGPVDYVYDISDTYLPDSERQHMLFAATDEEILNELADPFKTDGYVPEWEVHCLRASMALHGIAMEANLKVGNDYSGQIELLPENSHPIKIQLKKVDLQFRANYLLSVRDKASVGESFATIVHELGHFFCHHLAPRPAGAWKQRCLDHTTQEFEAEAVSYIVCTRFGILTPSAKYLNGYYSNHKNIPEISIETVFTACNQIINMINGIKPMQGILYKHDNDFRKQIDTILKL